MAQFDVYRNPNRKTNKIIPYLIDLQADLLNDFATRSVAPLILASDFGKIVRILNPQFEIEGKKIVMSTAELAGISARNLGEKIGNLNKHRHTILAAIDFLFTGF